MGESYRGKSLLDRLKGGNGVDSSHTVYGFQPQKGVPIAFSVLFAISTVIHIYQNLYPPRNNPIHSVDKLQLTG